MKNRFSRRLGKPVASIQTAIELKPNALELNFLHKNVDKDLNFAMMIKKVDIFLMGGTTGRKQWISFFLRFKPLFFQSGPTNPTKVAEQVYLSVLQHPTEFQAKMLTGNFFF